jgi:hypothetical protein
MGQMFFYDIMMLYKRWENFVNEENEQQELQRKEYENTSYENNFNTSDIMKDVKEMTSNFRLPNLNDLY